MMSSFHHASSSHEYPSIPKLDYVPRIDPRIKAWFGKMSFEEQEGFNSYFPRLSSLLRVVLDGGFLEAMVNFWVPEASVFRFGSHELAPTLEEYGRLLGWSLNGDIVKPTFGGGRKKLGEFLGMKRKNLESDGGNLSRVSMDFVIDRFGDISGFENHMNDFIGGYDAWESRRPWVLALCLFAHLLFPQPDGKIDGDLVWIVEETAKGGAVIPMILAETFWSLSHCHIHEGGFFMGSLALLQLWMTGHFQQTEGPKRAAWFTDDIIPVLSKKQLVIGDKLAWFNFLENLTPDEIRWFTGWISCKDAIMRAARLSYLPLVGLHGVVPYNPSRVLRQFGRCQTIPISTDMSEFMFPCGAGLKNAMPEALRMWDSRICIVWEEIDETCGTDPTYDRWIKGVVGELPPLGPVLSAGVEIPAVADMEDVVMKLEADLARRSEAFLRDQDKYRRTIHRLKAQVTDLTAQVELQATATSSAEYERQLEELQARYEVMETERDSANEFVEQLLAQNEELINAAAARRGNPEALTDLQGQVETLTLDSDRHRERAASLLARYRAVRTERDALQTRIGIAQAATDRFFSEGDFSNRRSAGESIRDYLREMQACLE